MAPRKTSTDTQTPVPGPSTSQRENTRESSVTVDKPLTDEQLHEYRKAFEEFDTNGDGTISAEELTTVIRSLGFDPSEDSIRQLIRDVDIDENGALDFDEFVQLMQNYVRPMNSEELIFEAFQYIGGDGSGTITLDALRDKARELGLNFTDQELQDMIEEAAPDKDGKISYQGLIQFMSEDNETLWDAYKRRQVREEEEKELEEQRRQEAEREAELRQETDERVPDIEEIASQFDRSTYDEFSRQTNGRRLIKKPGKRVPISRTRLQYLQRKAELQGLDLDEYTEMHEHKDGEGIRRVASSKDVWMGSIHDDKIYDTQFKSNPPRAYRHVESRLHAPSQRLAKQPHGVTPRDKNIDRDKKNKLVLQAAVVTDFDKELKKIQKSREAKKPSVSASNMFPMKLTSRRSKGNTENINTKNLDSYLARKKMKDEYNINYNMWRTFFERAVKQINVAKQKIDKIEIALKDAHSEISQTKSTNYTTEYAKKKGRQNLRPNVITPTLDNPNQVKVEVHKPPERRPLKQSNLLNDTSSTNYNSKTKHENSSVHKKNNGSYVTKFRESRGLSVHDSTDQFSVGTQDSKKSWKPPKKTVPVVTKDSLDLYY